MRHCRPIRLTTTIAGILTMSLAATATAETSVEPSNTFELSFAGSYLAGRGASFEYDVDAAIKYYGSALTLAPDDAILVERSFLLRLAGGEVEGALALTDQLLEKEPQHPMARLARVASSIKRRDYAKALSELNAMGPDQVNDLTSGLIGAWAEQGAGNTDAALARISEIGGPEWFDIFKNFHAGLIADVAGRTEEAVTFMTKAREVGNAGLHVAEAYARVQARAGNTQAALAAFQDYEDAGQNHPLIDRLRAEIAAGKTPAPTVADPVAGVAEVLYGIGAQLAGDQMGESAAAYLQLAIFLNDKNDLALMALGDLLQQAGRYQEAIDTYRRVDATSPLHDRVEVQAGISLQLLGQTDTAMAALQKIVDEDPGNLDAVLALSNLQRGEELYRESAETLSKGLARIDKPLPSHWRLFYYRGIDYERSKQWPLAEADFKKALELNPDQPQVLNYLGYSWVDMGVNLEEALEMVRTAVDLSQDDGDIVDSLGWAYYRLGRYDDAVRELERAVELKPQEPVINDHLGDAYWQVGRKREARFQWSHALDFGPDEAMRPAIRAKLENGLPPPAQRVAPPPPAPEPGPKTDAGDAAAGTTLAALPAKPETPETVEVAPGDSLWSLAGKIYGDPELFRIIYNANRDRIDNPDLIVPGMRLSIPRAAAAN